MSEGPNKLKRRNWKDIFPPGDAQNLSSWLQSPLETLSCSQVSVHKTPDRKTRRTGGTWNNASSSLTGKRTDERCGHITLSLWITSLCITIIWLISFLPTSLHLPPHFSIIRASAEQTEWFLPGRTGDITWTWWSSSAVSRLAPSSSNLTLIWETLRKGESGSLCN